LLAIITIIIFNASNLFAQFSGGSGTLVDPYQITSKADMEELADSVNTIADYSLGKHFLLMNDITDSLRSVIGYTFSSNIVLFGDTTYLFDGNFDGGGHKITLSINKLDTAAGVFGGISSTALIENLNVDGKVTCRVIIQQNICAIAAGIAGMSAGTINNCKNFADIFSDCSAITVAMDVAGGIVGSNIEGIVNNCENNGSVGVTRTDAGGIVGWNYYATISNCHNNGRVYGNMYVGGIVAASYVNTYFQNPRQNMINNCVNTGNIYITLSYAGGIAGVVWASTTIENCVNTGIIKCDGTNGYIGGIAGLVLNTVVTKCINTNVVEGINNVGSILGDGGSNVTIEDCYYDIQKCKYKAVNNQPHPGVQGQPTIWMINELLKW
jgi:hypothetical protein